MIDRKTYKKTSRSKALRPLVRPVGSFLPRITKNAFAKFGFSTTTLLTDWAGIVGADFAKFTRPERLRWPRRQVDNLESSRENESRAGATLTIRVDPARALEAEYGAQQIIERINSFFGYKAISQIRILQAPLTQPQNAESEKKKQNPQKGPISADPPPPAIVQIRDTTLRNALTRLNASIKRYPDEKSAPRNTKT